MQTFRNGQKAAPFYRFWKYVHTHRLTFDWITTVIKLYYLLYYSTKSLVLLRIQGFFIDENQKKRAVSSLLQPPPPFGRKPCFTRRKSRALVLWHVFCPPHSVAVRIFPVSGFVHLFIIQQPVEKTRVKCTSYARPCFFLCPLSVHCTPKTSSSLEKCTITANNERRILQKNAEPTKSKEHPVPKSSKK